MDVREATRHAPSPPLCPQPCPPVIIQLFIGVGFSQMFSYKRMSLFFKWQDVIFFRVCRIGVTVAFCIVADVHTAL